MPRSQPCQLRYSGLFATHGGWFFLPGPALPSSSSEKAFRRLTRIAVERGAAMSCSFGAGICDRTLASFTLTGSICRQAAARSHTESRTKKMRYLYELSCPIQSHKGFSLEAHDARHGVDNFSAAIVEKHARVSVITVFCAFFDDAFYFRCRCERETEARQTSQGSGIKAKLEPTESKTVPFKTAHCEVRTSSLLFRTPPSLARRTTRTAAVKRTGGL